jgi:hypothetical protein
MSEARGDERDWFADSFAVHGPKCWFEIEDSPVPASPVIRFIDTKFASEKFDKKVRVIENG